MYNLYMDNVKTVLLDIDGTVMDFLRGQKRAFFTACSLNHLPYSESAYQLFDMINRKYWRMFENGKIGKKELVFERFSTLFEELNVPTDPVTFEYCYQKSLGEQCFFMEGALDGVKYLKSKYSLLVVTNGVKETQLNRIKKSGLGEYVDKVFVSEEVGWQKPQREFFDVALEGVDRESAVIVGDSLSSDIQGGIDAGIKTVWFNSDGQKGSVKPDFEVHSWAEICAIL